MSLSGRLIRIKENRLVKHVIVLAGGTAFAQLIAMLLMPVLTRLYSPEDFNVLAVYVALVSVASVAASLRLDIAIPLPEDDSDAANLAGAALIAAVAISALIGALILVLERPFIAVLKQPDLQPYTWIIPFGVLSASVYSIVQYWATRRKLFAVISRTKIIQSSAAGSFQVVAGVLSPSPWGLIFGTLIQNALGVLGIAKTHWHQEKATFSMVNLPHMRQMLKRYDQFPKFSTFEALANNAAIQLPVIVIAAQAIGPEAGYLMLAMQIMQAPMALMGSAVAQVYLSVAPSSRRDSSLGELTASMLGGLIKAGVGPLICVGLIAPAAFGVIFGNTWERAGVLVAWMTPWFITQLLVSPVSMALHIIDKQRTALLLQLVGLVIRLGAVAIGSMWYLDSISELYAVSGLVFYGLYLSVVLYAVKPPLQAMLKHLKSSIGIILAWCIVGGLARVGLSGVLL